jgi:hypothetical protein
MKNVNTTHAAKIVFGGGCVSHELTYLGVPIEADFELTYENLAPYVTQVLDLAAPIEGCGNFVKSIIIKNGTVEVE